MKLKSIEIIAALGVFGLVVWMLSSSQEAAPAPQQTWQSQLTAVRLGQSTSIDLPDLNLSPDAIRDLGDVSDQITELNLAGETLALQIDRIAACRHLRVLHLRTAVGDHEFEVLSKLPELEVLDLPLAMQLTDQGLAVIAEHPKLKLVRLRAPKVTDAGLLTFLKMPSLKWLHLIEIPITDAGLVVLRDMPRLESLYLDGDKATDDGLSMLVTARPDLHFHRDQVHIPSDPRKQDGHAD